MMRVQYEVINNKLFEIVDEVMDMETKEAQDVLLSLRQSLHKLHPDYKNDRCSLTPDMFEKSFGPKTGSI